jgi:hypothetical protein
MNQFKQLISSWPKESSKAGRSIREYMETLENVSAQDLTYTEKMLSNEFKNKVHFFILLISSIRLIPLDLFIDQHISCYLQKTEIKFLK